MIVKSKNATKSYFVKKCNMIKQNMHYFWNQQPKIDKKQVPDIIQQIWCRVV